MTKFYTGFIIMLIVSIWAAQTSQLGPFETFARGALWGIGAVILYQAMVEGRRYR